MWRLGRGNPELFGSSGGVNSLALPAVWGGFQVRGPKTEGRSAGASF